MNKLVSNVRESRASGKSKLLQRAEESRESFDAFARFVLGVKPAKHQEEWVEFAQYVGDNPTVNLKGVIVAPPGSGKSSLLGIGLILWLIGKDRTRHYGLLSYADKVAHERSTAIRKVIEENKAYKLTFPEVKPDEASWNKSSFRVQRPDTADIHPTLRAGGTTSAITAYRLDGLLIDDPVDLKGNTTLEQRDKMWENYLQTIFTRMLPHAFQLVIGTRWNDDDFIGRLIQQTGIKDLDVFPKIKDRKIVPTDWNLSFIKAEPEPETSYWPEVYHWGYLDKEIKQQKQELWAIQYQGDTTGGEAGIIRKVHTYEGRPEWLIHPRNPDKRDLLIASGWDTAYKKGEENDFSVGYVGGLDQDGQVWILDRVKGKFLIHELVEEMTRLHDYWETWTDFIEDMASGTPAIQTLMVEAPDVPTEPVYYHGGKIPRGHALAPWLHGQHVLLPREAPWFEDCEYNLTHFPNAAHDDDIDALFILCDNLLKARHPREYTEGRPGLELDFV